MNNIYDVTDDVTNCMQIYKANELNFSNYVRLGLENLYIEFRNIQFSGSGEEEFQSENIKMQYDSQTT